MHFPYKKSILSLKVTFLGEIGRELGQNELKFRLKLDVAQKLRFIMI